MKEKQQNITHKKVRVLLTIENGGDAANLLI